ncbi:MULTISPECIES: methyltransferase [Pontibacillus]|uniref:Methyltransferase n=1 Tax=Pontibacillus chungwhensis TaxID=265426 RepID=A0ABY8UXM1_9BACI|nr:MULTISPECIES: methyltransferase [Pontibacillus]MCD5324190.1 methyltransferase [Pontibacillus sp. HN14]WIF97752.1 methyltransferase [Pontibacillus chungwhensis]
MEKIVVEIRIPVLSQTYDVYIPLTNKVHELEMLLKGAFKDLSDGAFTPSGNTVLCDDKGNVLDGNRTALELGLKNGSKLLFI